MPAQYVKPYVGSYARVAAFARAWREERHRAEQTAGRGTFVPLAFQPGEAFQFDWSEDWATIGGERVKLQAAHTKLSHSRAFLVRAYPLQTHEMLVGGAFTLNMMENTLKELRSARSHNGTNRYRSRETVFGDAHWGSWRKIVETVGDTKGIVLGEDYDPRHNDQAFDIRNDKTWGQGGKEDLITLSPKFGSGHVLVFSGPGGGKTAGIVIPTCLTYQHSLIVVDPELEILPATKAARIDMGRDVRAIRIGEGIDIIKFLRQITERRDQVYAHLAKIITEPSREQTSDVSDFFREEAQNTIAGLLNHYDSQGDANPFKRLLGVISKEEDEFKKVVASIVANEKEGSLLQTTLASYNKMDSRTFTSFQSTIKQALKWAPYPDLLALVSTDPKGAVDPLDPNTDLYIQIKKSDMETYPGLVRLIVGTIAYVIDDSPDGHGLTGLGFFIEEVPFAVAYIPLALAICHRHRTHIFWLICGHFAWVAVISGWGLHQLGYNPVLTIPAVTVALVLAALAMAWLGIGLLELVRCGQGRSRSRGNWYSFLVLRADFS